MAFEGSSRFKVIGKLGEGGMGAVYEAFDNSRGMRVAIKALRQIEPAGLYRFKREFRTLSQLSHPNIVTLYELVAEHDEWFFTMEVIPGNDLIQFVRGYRSPKKLFDLMAQSRTGPPPIPTVAQLVDVDILRHSLAQLAGALHFLHERGVVHRDLKPANIRVTPDNRVVLMDFGIVSDLRIRITERDSKQRLGTPPFMAPEQIAGEDSSPATDWYALGVILYLALTGRLPFRGSARDIIKAKLHEKAPPLELFVDDVPEDLSQLCIRLLQRDPRDRPPGDHVLAALGTSARPLADPALKLFIGRDGELRALHSAYRHSCSNKMVCAFIEGESGMGKSALVDHFLDSLSASTARSGRESPLILAGRCHERESLSFKAFDGIVDHLGQVLLGMPAPQARALVPPGTLEMTRLFPVLRAVPGCEARPQRGLKDPHEQKRRGINCLRALLSNLAEYRPVILQIDDLQWADQDSLDLLVELMAPGANSRILFLATVRSENILADSQLPLVIDSLAKHHHSVRLALAPLTNEEQLALITGLLGNQQAPSRLDDTFWSESGGSPLFFLEAASFLLEAGEEIGERSQPNLSEVLHARIERLPADARGLLQFIACAGEPTPMGVLGKAAGLTPSEAERSVATLRSGHWARVAKTEPDLWLVWYHDRVRETVDGQLDQARRGEVHRQLAIALEQWGYARQHTLGRHWIAAGETGRGIEHLVAAALQATETLAFESAARLYQEALAVAQPEAELELLIHLGHARELAGHNFDAADAYQRAATRAEQNDALDLTRRAADNLLRSGHIEDGLLKLQSVMKQVGAPFARSRGRAALSLAVQRIRLRLRGMKRSTDTGQPGSDELARLDTMYAAATSLGMIDHLRGAAAQTWHLLTALQTGDPRREKRALAIECAYLAAKGSHHTRRSMAMSRDLLEYASEAGDPYLVGIAEMAIGGTAVFSGQPGQALEPLIDCELQLNRSADATQWERITARYFLALAQTAIGDFHGLTDTVTRSVGDAERRQDLYARAMFMCIPNTWVHLAADHVGLAQEQIETALDGWPNETFYMVHYVEAFSRILISLYQGNGTVAESILTRAMPGIRGLLLHRMPFVRNEYSTLRARAAIQRGDTSGASKALRDVRRVSTTFSTGVVRSLEAGLHATASDTSAAALKLTAAAKAFEDVGAKHLAAACRYQHEGIVNGTREAPATALQNLGVTDPDRIAHMLLPGFRPTASG